MAAKLNLQYQFSIGNMLPTHIIIHIQNTMFNKESYANQLNKESDANQLNKESYANQKVITKKWL